MPPVVDAHAHVFSSADRDHRDVNELVPAGRTAPMDDYVALLDSAGVDHAVLVPLDPNDDYVAASLAAAPDRFRAIAVAGESDVGLGDVDPVDHLRERRSRFPFSAVRTTWLGHPGRPFDESPIHPLLAYLEQEGLILWSYLSPDQAPFLEDVGIRYPELRVVLNHFGFTPEDLEVDRHGRPWFATGLTERRRLEVAQLARFPAFHLMFSGHYALSHQPYPYQDLWTQGLALAETFGPDRTLWGSDWPWIDAEPGYQQTLDLVTDMLGQFGTSGRHAILGGTADRLFGFT